MCLNIFVHLNQHSTRNMIIPYAMIWLMQSIISLLRCMASYTKRSINVNINNSFNYTKFTQSEQLIQYSYYYFEFHVTLNYVVAQQEVVHPLKRAHGSDYKYHPPGRARQPLIHTKVVTFIVPSKPAITEPLGRSVCAAPKPIRIR
jgi:hypothetical protein